MRRFEEVICFFKTPNVRRQWILALAILIACAAGFVVRAYSRRAISPPSFTVQPVIVEEERSAIESIARPQEPSTEGVETVIVTLTPNGFYPKEIVRNEGRIIVVVVNRTGLEEISLSLDRQTGERLRAAKVDRSKPGWGDIFSLTPGQYAITEENHSDWASRITVRAK